MSHMTGRARHHPSIHISSQGKGIKPERLVEETMCCKAMNSHCMACSMGMSEEELCALEEHADLPGCMGPLSSLESEKTTEKGKDATPSSSKEEKTGGKGKSAGAGVGTGKSAGAGLGKGKSAGADLGDGKSM